MPEHQLPEMKRTALDELVLQVLIRKRYVSLCSIMLYRCSYILFF